jgi:hypothetical protein
MNERKAVTRQVAPRYQRATKKQRAAILDEFTTLTGYNRSYAAFLLRNWGRKRVLTIRGVRTIYVPGHHRRKRTPSKRHNRIYDPERILPSLKFFWGLSGGLCGKRLAPFIRTTLPILEHHEELIVAAEIKQKLLSMSPATIDRLLAPERNKLRLKGRSTTKPGTLLKHQIPIRTFSDWDEKQPGFVEIDLVAHDGGIPESSVIHTLDLVDVATGWTETRALKTKAQRWVLEALHDISACLPFAIKGIDSDNGSEFINRELYRYCIDHRITFTRSRPFRKNDCCFVEEKNYSVVRKTVGYYRYDSEDELHPLEQLYSVLRLFTNFFLPVMKLTSKTRNGSTITKPYEHPTTPSVRILNCPDISKPVQRRLIAQYNRLNPAALRRQITQLQEKLLTLAQLKQTAISTRRKQLLNRVFS